MLKQACIVLAISGLVLGLGARHGQAGWSDARSNLTLAASSPVVSIKKHKNDDDDDDNNNDDNHHGKGKKNNEGAGLSECTIIQPGGGGGCKTGLKWVCEKMKSGNKCCGCVADKSKGTSTSQSGGDGKTSSGGIKPVDETPGATLLLPYFECDLSKGNTCSNGGKK